MVRDLHERCVGARPLLDHGSRLPIRDRAVEIRRSQSTRRDLTVDAFRAGSPDLIPEHSVECAYWGLTEHHDRAELVVDLNGFLENDYVELVLDVQGALPRRVPIPELTRPVGDVRIIERKECLIVDVTNKRSSEISLRGYKNKSSSSESKVVRYVVANPTGRDAG